MVLRVPDPGRSAVPASLPPGPYRTVDVQGSPAPWYMVPFDEAGRCTGPRTRDELARTAAGDEVTDVFVFSHGWNNDWAIATGKYESFLRGFSRMRADHDLDVGRPFRPVLAGVFWPSTALVGADEGAPTIAADPTGAFDAEVAQERAEVAEVARLLPPDRVERFHRLVQAEVLEPDEAEELATMLLPVLGAGDDEAPGADEPTAAELASLWRHLPDLDASAPVADDQEAARAELEDFGTGSAGGDLAAAGWLDKLKPRNVVRALSMWVMKDRAGVVGAGGVSDLLVDLLRTDARVHLVGHSFGAKVCLSALCRPAELPRPVSSVLLLQPAVSHLCFAPRVAGSARPGGYAAAPDRSTNPVLSTFSRHDVPLTRLFHLAARRRDDLAEQRIAAAPDRYAALGGVGPHDAGPRCRTVAVKDVGQGYDLGPNAPARLYGVEASRTVSGHSDISNPSTHWALFDLVRSS